MADIVKTYHHRVSGPTQMYTIDGDAAVANHPNEWSVKPWTDAEAAKAETAQRAADKRDDETGGRPQGRVANDAPDHAMAENNPPPKPRTAAEQGLAPGILPMTDTVAANEDGVQAAVPNSKPTPADKKDDPKAPAKG